MFNFHGDNRFFSGGYVSDTLVKNRTGDLTIHYERFGRLQTEFKINASASKLSPDKNTYRIGGDFSEFYEIEKIWPHPDKMYSKEKDLYLVYNNSEKIQDSNIWLFVTPLRPGK